MNTKNIFDKIDELSEEYLGVWENLCNIESPTDDKESVDKAGNYLVGIAEKFGWKIEKNIQEKSGDAVCITMNPDAQKAPVCLSGHIDTVHPKGLFGYPPVKIDRENGKIYGPGVVDCKGGVVSSLLAMAALEKCGYKERPVKLILQSDEEVSSLYSGKGTVKFMADCAKDCVAFLNCEGHTRGKITVERKGIIRYILDITGKAAHSSLCYLGKSAVLEAAHKIIEIEEAMGEKWKDKGGITCNCGVIEGGTVANTVPEKCSITVDIRYKTAQQLEEVQERMEKIAATSYIGDTTCTLRIKSQRVQMERCEKNISLFDRINEIFRANGLPETAQESGSGGSDAADMTSCGIPTVDNLGTCGGRIHSQEEWAYLDSLAFSAKMLAAVTMEI